MVRLAALLAVLVASPAGAQVFDGSPLLETSALLDAPTALLDCPLTGLAADGTLRCSDGRVVTTVRNGPAWCMDGTQVAANVPCVSALGLESYGSVTSYWLQGADVCSATAAGTATCTTDPGGWQVLESTTGGGRRRTTAGNGAGAYTLTCELAAGTATTARLAVSSTEDGDLSCDVALGATFQRVSCVKTLAGVTGLAATLSVVGAGSIKVRQCQLEKAAYPGRRCDAGASNTTCPGDTHTVSSAGMPISAGWCEVIFTPGALQRPGESVLSTSWTAYSGDGRQGLEIEVRSPTGIGGDIGMRSGSPDALNIIWGATGEYLPGVPVRVGVVWGRGSGVLYRDGVRTGLQTSGVSIPTGTTGILYLGKRFTDPLWSYGAIRNFRCGAR